MVSASSGGASKSTTTAAHGSSKASTKTVLFYLIAGVALGAAMAASIFAPATRSSLSSIFSFSSRALIRPTSVAAVASSSSRLQSLHSHFPTPIQARNMSANTTSLLDAIAHRRSVYGLTSELTVPASRIVELCQTAVKQVPSAFNSQSTRLVVLLGADHKAFWNDIVGPAMKATQDAASWERSAPKIAGFGNAAGTIVFLENTATIKQMQERSPAIGHLFPDWSDHTSGMHQFALWLAVEAEGMGANLQHYNFNPDVEKAFADKYKLPGAELKMRSQLVFGKPAEGAWPTTQKDKLSTDETVKVFGKL